LETLLCRTILGIEQLGEAQVFVGLRIAWRQINRLSQFILRGHVLHLLESNLTEQTMRTDILAICGENGFSLLTSFPLLRRR
jgi:hypothetical protein